jgi:hypothetical protein
MGATLCRGRPDGVGASISRMAAQQRGPTGNGRDTFGKLSAGSARPSKNLIRTSPLLDVA